MAVDPNDLLIFQNRSGHKELPEPPEDKEKLLKAPKAQSQQAYAAKEVMQSQQGQQAVVQQEPKAAEKAPEQQQNQEPSRKSKTISQNIKAAGGLKCVNHPWRNAYALCNYCSRPFCYADLIPYSKNLYCIEDIDRVSSGSFSGTAGGRGNPITSIAGILMILNAGITTYLNYYGIILLVNALKAEFALSGGAIQPSLIYALSEKLIAYPFQAVSLFTASILLISGLITVVSRRGIYFALFVDLVVMFAFPYEYFVTGQDSMLIIAVTAFVTLVAFAFGRIGSGSIAAEGGTAQKYMDWPRPEAF
ncbi:MAG: hypothetical protein QXF01_00265 [Candidatus Micrarchaeaceae archaeon]